MNDEVDTNSLHEALRIAIDALQFVKDAPVRAARDSLRLGTGSVPFHAEEALRRIRKLVEPAQ